MGYEDRYKKFGSPLFTLKNHSIAAGAGDIIDFEGIRPACVHLPFNLLVVTQQGEDDIEVKYDGVGNAKLFAAGTVLKTENIWFRRLVVRNIGTNAITANKIEFCGQRLPVSEGLARVAGNPLTEIMKILLGRQ